MAQKRKILLVDDDTNLLITLGDFLKFEGYDVTTVDSGEQALAKIANMTPDLIILDMSMPGMGGVGFLKKISDEDGKPKHSVLVLTARANMAEFFADVAVDGFIAKPCDPGDLLMEIGRILFLTSGSIVGEEEKVVEKKSVLIAEDDPDVAEEFEMAFVDAGFNVDCVGRGPEVLEKAIVELPDAIIMKCFLTGMNADVVAGTLWEMPKTKNVPIILYDDSGSDIPDDHYINKSTSIKKYIRSLSMPEILGAVGELLGTE